MNDKTEKKIRKMFRREIRDKVDALTNEYFGDAPVFNEKPKWCPQWLWLKCIAFIIDAGFLLKYEANKKKKERVAEERKANENDSTDSTGSEDK